MLASQYTNEADTLTVLWYIQILVGLSKLLTKLTLSSGAKVIAIMVCGYGRRHKTLVELQRLPQLFQHAYQRKVRAASNCRKHHIVMVILYTGYLVLYPSM